VVEIAADVVPTAEAILKALGVKEVVVEDLDAGVATLFDDEAAPVPEPSAAPSA
jgi:hypothetical protein